MSTYSTYESPRLPIRYRHAVNQVSFGPADDLMATGDVDLEVRVFDGGRERFALSLVSVLDKVRPTQRIRCLKFSDDGETLYVATHNVTAVDVRSGSVLWSYTPPRMWGFLVTSAMSVVVAPGGFPIASFDNGTVSRFLPSGTVVHTWRDVDVQRSLQLESDGILVGCDSFAIGLFDAVTGRRLARHALRERAHAMALIPNSDRIALRTVNDVRVLDVVSGEVTILRRTEPGLPVIAAHPTEDLIAYTEGSECLILSADGVLLSKGPISGGRPLSISFTPSGREVAIGKSDATVQRIAVA